MPGASTVAPDPPPGAGGGEPLAVEDGDGDPLAVGDPLGDGLGDPLGVRDGWVGEGVGDCLVALGVGTADTLGTVTGTGTGKATTGFPFSAAPV